MRCVLAELSCRFVTQTSLNFDYFHHKSCIYSERDHPRTDGFKCAALCGRNSKYFVDVSLNVEPACFLLIQRSIQLEQNATLAYEIYFKTLET